MTQEHPERLRKQLGLRDVYALATGATLSSGFFLLPGLATVGVGPAVPIAYALAGVLLVPGLLSMAELTTAMPKAGGIYYFTDRSMGPLVGTVAGLGTWVSLVLKSAFALVGMGAYLSFLFPGLEVGPVAAALAVSLGVLNYLGAKNTGRFQALLLIGLLALLAVFICAGLTRIDPTEFDGAFSAAGTGLTATAGLVMVSYMGLSNVASVAEEVENPDRNLPRGILLAFATVVTLYVVGTGVMIGVAGADTLALGGGDLTPVATVANMLSQGWGLGEAGAILMTVAALFAFLSVANAGILASSRYPLAMARDHILPDAFGRIGPRGTPTLGIVATVVLILLFVSLGPSNIAKLASAFLLVTFSLACTAVIVMRESRIESYDPGFRSPFYPALHIAGVLAAWWMIVTMGILPSVFAGGVVLAGATWFSRYAQHRVNRGGAILHVFERLGRKRQFGLDRELREIMKERFPQEADPFFDLVTSAHVLNMNDDVDFDDLVDRAAQTLADDLNVPASLLRKGFRQGTRTGNTPVSHGVALPHLRLPGISAPRMALARIPRGASLSLEDVLGADGEPIRAVFFLASPDGDPGWHLRTLAHIARRVDDDGFMRDWLSAESNDRLRATLLRDEHAAELTLGHSPGSGSKLVGKHLRDVELPTGTLLTMIVRGDDLIIPDGDTVLEVADRLTLMGRAEGIDEIRRRYATRVS